MPTYDLKFSTNSCCSEGDRGPIKCPAQRKLIFKYVVNNPFVYAQKAHTLSPKFSTAGIISKWHALELFELAFARLHAMNSSPLTTVSQISEPEVDLGLERCVMGAKFKQIYEFFSF